ncbi:MAG: response regulator [Ginsengibacter sp.]
MTKVLLADDHEIVRKGLKAYIYSIVPDSDVEKASNGDSAYERIKHHDYDLIVLDITMPGIDSFGLVSNILAVKPRSRILMFSMNSEEVFAKKYLESGAMGYLNKDASADEIKQAINTVLNNKRYISASLTQRLTDAALGIKPNNKNPFDLLSQRELEITRHLIKGESVSQIGSFLNLHTSTVGTHKARIFEKLNCKNIIEIIDLARLYKFNQPN